MLQRFSQCPAKRSEVNKPNLRHDGKDITGQGPIAEMSQLVPTLCKQTPFDPQVHLCAKLKLRAGAEDIPSAAVHTTINKTSLPTGRVSEEIEVHLHGR